MAKALGTDDSITTCDCCGKSNLKHTVIIELDDGEIVHYGSVCATRNTGKASKVINAEIRAHHEAQRVAAAREYRASPEYLAERARFAERDEVARETGVRMVGSVAMEFVREAAAAADEACRIIAKKYSLNVWEIRA